MQFPAYCQTRGDRLAHALWLFTNDSFERADLARLIDAEFPVEIDVSPAPKADAVADAVADALLKIQDREGRKLLPMVPWSWAEEIANALRKKGLIRG